MTPDEFFGNDAVSKQLFAVVCQAVETLGPVSVRGTRSQIAFRRRAFAWVWMPGQYLKGRHTAPLVLTLALPRRDGSPRWKQIVEPVPGRFTHHLELNRTADIDEEVKGWLPQAWKSAA